MLPTFEDHDVSLAAVRITKCGDGLSEALKVEPEALELGDRVSYVLTGVVSQINHRDKEGIVTRLHTVETEKIAKVDGKVAEQMLTEEIRRIEKAKELLDGQTSIDDEIAAQQREAADDTDTPTDIAAAAAKRAKAPK